MDAFFAEAVNFDLVFVPNAGSRNLKPRAHGWSKLKDMNGSWLFIEPRFLVFKESTQKFFLKLDIVVYAERAKVLFDARACVGVN